MPRLGVALGLGWHRRRGAAAGPSVRGAPATGVGGDPTIPAHAAGDTLLVGAVYQVGSTPTATSWTRIVGQDDGSGEGLRLVVFKLENAVGNETMLSPSANPFSSWAAVAVKDATAVDSLAVASGLVTGAFNCPSVNVLVAPALLIDFVMAFNGGSVPAVTTPAGATLIASVPDGSTPTRLVVGSRAVAATGPTGTRASASDMLVGWAVGSVAVK